SGKGKDIRDFRPEDFSSEMCALLAASAERWKKQSASGFVRSLRECRQRNGRSFKMKYICFVALPFYLLDRVTKYLVIHSIDPDRPVIVIPGFFHLVNITNTGAAFGSFKNYNAFFIAISCIALLFALILLLGRHQPDSERPKSLWWIQNFWRDLSLALL